MEIILLYILITLITLNIFISVLKDKGNSGLRREITDQNSILRQEINSTTQSSVEKLGGLLLGNQKNLEERFSQFSMQNEQKLENIRVSVESRLDKIQADNNIKLEEMRNTVDEKLQKTINERMTQSFKMVNDNLEKVYKGLGDMQSLATGVGDLKKVLSNVKTRGILGEYQLGAILEQILSPEQYETNVTISPKSRNRVEYAIKLPADDDRFIYLPIDAKFPADTYEALQDAYNKGDAASIENSRKNLILTIKNEAKSIRDKYILLPYTTEFAIMFLPFEGLYAEVVNLGLLEALQREFKVNIAGPSTMAALLNSLQMGFKTLAIQKRSSEVWKLLGGVKSEFSKFGDTLSQTQKRLEQANKELDDLIGVRTRQINRKLQQVEKIDDLEASEMFSEEIGAPIYNENEGC